MRIMGLVLKNLETGSISGKCSLCNIYTTEGFQFAFSENFQGYSYLYHSDQCLCPPCNYFIHNQDFRRKNWVASPEGIYFLQRQECQNVILSPPTPPFFLYITQTGQRQGWLNALQTVNYQKEKYIISTDWVGKFQVVRKQAIELFALCTQLRKMNISKSALRTGYLRPVEYRRISENSAEKLIELIQIWKQTPLWEVVVYVSD